MSGCGSKQIGLLADVASMLHKKTFRRRLTNTCFSSPMGQMFVKDINSWRGLVYEKRWGTVAHTVHNAIKRQHVLQ